MKRNIYVFTNTFPYGCSVEAFLENEMMVASHLDMDIMLIPLRRQKGCRKLPTNVSVCNDLISISILWKIWAICNLLVTHYVWKLFFVADRPRSKREWFQAIKYLYGAFLIEAFLIANKQLFHDDGILYSYWCNHTPLGLCLARKKHKYFRNFSIYSRAHGYDVYGKLVGSYFPYRKETLKMLDSVYVVSRIGCQYLQDHYPESKNKIKVSRLGVLPLLSKYVEKEKIYDVSFVSCSSVIPLKRVDMIFDNINYYCNNNPNLSVSWVHIGGGDNFVKLSRLVQSHASNLHIELLGIIDNIRIKELYLNKRFDIFLNMSVSEGIPVTIMEAISAGIPVVATDVGGNHEIVTFETGKLIPINFSPIQFEYAVFEIRNNLLRYRKTTLEFYENNFNAYNNYVKFYSSLILDNEYITY